LIYVTGEPALTLQAQMLSAGIGPQKGTLLANSPTALRSPLFWQIVPNGNKTVVRQIGPWQSTISDQGQQFAGIYISLLDRWPGTQAFATYDAVYLLADAVERSPSLAGMDLVAALEEIDLNLASGRYHFPYGSAHLPADSGASEYMWHQWPDAQTLYLQYAEPGQPSDEMPVIWPKTYSTVDSPVIR
jgi:hypothetical protein